MTIRGKTNKKGRKEWREKKKEKQETVPSWKPDDRGVERKKEKDEEERLQRKRV